MIILIATGSIRPSATGLNLQEICNEADRQEPLVSFRAWCRHGVALLGARSSRPKFASRCWPERLALVARHRQRPGFRAGARTEGQRVSNPSPILLQAVFLVAAFSGDKRAIIRVRLHTFKRKPEKTICALQAAPCYRVHQGSAGVAWRPRAQ
jgi:hypothetical protein